MVVARVKRPGPSMLWEFARFANMVIHGCRGQQSGSIQVKRRIETKYGVEAAIWVSSGITTVILKAERVCAAFTILLITVGVIAVRHGTDA